MAQRTGSLYVDLTLNFAKFTEGLDKSRTRATIFGVAIGNIMSNIALSVARMGKDAALSLPRLVDHSIDLADAMGKSAQKAQISVESLSALAHAANLSDVSLETLTVTLGRFGRNIAEAQSGNKKMAQSFRDVGLSANELKTLSVDQIFAKVAGGFAQIPDGAKKAQIGFNLFGRAWQDLVPLLNQGTDGISRAIAEAKELGLVIGGDTAKQAEEFNDNIKRLHGVVSGFALGIAKDLLPQLDDLSKTLVQVAADSELPKKLAEEIGAAFRFAVIEADRLAISWLAFVISLQEGILAIEKAGYAFHILGDDGAKDIAAISGRLAENKKLLFDLYDAGVKLGKLPKNIALPGLSKPTGDQADIVDPETQKKLDSLTASFEKAFKPADDLNKELQQLSAIGKSLADITTVYGDEAIKASAAQREHGIVVTGMVAQIESLAFAQRDQVVASKLAVLSGELWASTLDKIGDGSLAAAIKVGELTAAIELGRSEIERLQAIGEPRELDFLGDIKIDDLLVKIPKLKTDMEELSTTGKGIGLAISSGIEDAIQHWEGFRNLAISVLDDIAATILRNMAIAPLTEWLSGILGGLGKGIGGGNGGGPLPFVGNFAFAAGGPVPHFAEGGEVPAILHSGEFVMNRRATQRIGTGVLAAMNSGSGTNDRQVVINYNIDARGAGPGTGEEIRHALLGIEDRAVSRAVRTMREMTLRTA